MPGLRVWRATEADAERFADLHGLSFAVGWTPEAMSAQLSLPGAVGILAGSAKVEGFALGQVVVDEAELRSIGVAPAARGNGLGRALLRAFEREAAADGATRVVLEVAADNAPARALYARFGYRESGCRAGYYRSGRPEPVDALVLFRDIYQ